MIKNVLVTTDFSPLSDLAIGPAAYLASGVGARLIAVHVIGGEKPPKPDPDAPHYQGLKRLREADDALEAQALANLEERLKVLQGVKWKAVIGRGGTVEGILHVARVEKADLIVISSLGRTGFQRLFLGSISEELTRESPLPVLVWKEPASTGK